MTMPSPVVPAGPPELSVPAAAPDVADVRTMHRLCRRADGGAALLAWLGRRAGCWAGLLDASGAVLLGDRSALGPAERALVLDATGSMRRRGLRAFTFAAEAGTESDGKDRGRPARRGALVAVETPDRSRGLVLAVVGDRPVPPPLLTDAATLIGTCWWVEETRRTRRRVEAAEARCREAVLRLLMASDVPAAGQVAATLHAPLPDPLRVHLIECRPGERAEAIRRVTAITAGSFVAPCPVHPRQVVVLASPHPSGAAPGTSTVEEAVAAALPGCAVGTGETVALGDAAIGHQQAFHALAVARGRTHRRARFDADLDLPTILGPDGRTWADALLEPLTGYVPARASDPDSHVLITTARSWLAFGSGATRHLKIHRNTLSGRLRRIEEILGLDLDRPARQAVLDLALRTRAAPRPAGTVGSASGEVDLHRLLRQPAVRQWARSTLRPLRTARHADVLEQTLRAWLADLRLSGTAAALGISVGGLRKRMERLEQVFRRSLLHPPSARHDLWMAVRVADLDPGAAS